MVTPLKLVRITALPGHLVGIAFDPGKGSSEWFEVHMTHAEAVELITEVQNQLTIHADPETDFGNMLEKCFDDIAEGDADIYGNEKEENAARQKAEAARQRIRDLVAKLTKTAPSRPSSGS